MAVILIGGGARSGKSSYALKRAREFGGRCVLIATATTTDDDMAQRIAKHQRDRGKEIPVIEEPIEVARAIRETDADVILVDCLTLWLANLMAKDCDVTTASNDLFEAAHASRATVIFVTNEVGCGVVPETEIGCKFRDLAGFLNQRVANCSDEVFLMIFGQPLRVK